MTSVTAKFEGAVGTLVGEGPVKQRLAQAWTQHLSAVRPDDLPHSLGDEFSQLKSALERIRPCGQESRTQASVRKMSFREAGHHAGVIVRIFGELLRVAPRVEAGRESLKVVECATSDAPPRYLTVHHGAARNG
jgi:hypothetical protein